MNKATPVSQSTRRRIITIAACAVAILAIYQLSPISAANTTATAQPRQPTAPQTPQPPTTTNTYTTTNTTINLAAIPIDNLANRLAALSPDDPAAYFDLAELIAAERWALGAEQLARTLYVLTLELRRTDANAIASATDRAGSLAASACFGLAELAHTEEERRWLLAVAGLLQPIGSPATGPLATRSIDADSPAYHLATALGLTRAGLGRRAQQHLDRPGVSELLDRYERLLDPAGLDGGARRLRQHIQAWPQCNECRNRRIVTSATRGEVRRDVCPQCRGNPGPQLDPREEVLQLRLEALLLQGIHRSWGAQSIADAGAPLRDADPAEIAPVYGINPQNTIFRNGQWTKPPDPEQAQAKHPENPTTTHNDPGLLQPNQPT